MKIRCWKCHGRGWLFDHEAGIYTTTANSDTLDEAPEAYKSMDDIVRLIEPTAEVLFMLKPKMNIKAAEGRKTREKNEQANQKDTTDD